MIIAEPSHPTHGDNGRKLRIPSGQPCAMSRDILRLPAAEITPTKKARKKSRLMCVVRGFGEEGESNFRQRRSAVILSVRFDAEPEIQSCNLS